MVENRLAGGTPKKICKVDLTGYIEDCYMLYLPIFMKGQGLKIPDNLKVFNDLIVAAIANLQLNNLKYNYLYISVEHKFVPAGNYQKRPGFHVDGYLTDDTNFVYQLTCDPTEVISIDEFNGPGDHAAGLELFDKLGANNKISKIESSVLYNLDKCIHRTPLITKDHKRLFVKISASNHKYNLTGNSINYKFNYDWKFYNREEFRNCPQNNQDFVEV